mgnify:CR=1 FL=1
MADHSAYLFAGKLNPCEVLEYYRKNSPKMMREDMQQFKEMPIQDQLELLFWLALHLNTTVGSCLVGAMSEDEARH